MDAIMEQRKVWKYDQSEEETKRLWTEKRKDGETERRKDVERMGQKNKRTKRRNSGKAEGNRAEAADERMQGVKLQTMN